MQQNLINLGSVLQLSWLLTMTSSEIEKLVFALKDKGFSNHLQAWKAIKQKGGKNGGREIGKASPKKPLTSDTLLRRVLCAISCCRVSPCVSTVHPYSLSALVLDPHSWILCWVEGRGR